MILINSAINVFRYLLKKSQWSTKLINSSLDNWTHYILWIYRNMEWQLSAVFDTHTHTQHTHTHQNIKPL